MKWLIFFSVLIHVAFLLSVFYIYFKSIIVKGLNPLKNLDAPFPAQRLVLFVADGLRAESFFKHECNRTEFLRDVILKEGIVGVSHTRVPTESRPGHVALIAGVYEDPSALLKGWQENPVDFDSVFNRSHKTYSFGSPDIVPIFAKGADTNKVFSEVYESSEEKFGGRTYLLDEWVFNKVESFLKNTEQLSEIKKDSQVVFFIHLLGLDTAGHVHKPHSKLYEENLKFVDEGIRKTVKLIENAFDNDGKTAYIFTADHGMTDRGSHGSGTVFETETPLVAWGSGVNYWNALNLKTLPKKFITIEGTRIPLFDVEQADITPLMSSLIGTSNPVNNFGKLPFIYLNSSNEYLAATFSNNAYQLYAQYNSLRQHSLKKTFKINFNQRESEIEDEINFLDENIKFCYTLNDFDNVTYYSGLLIDQLRTGIEFYYNYYKYDLLIALSFTMIGWILILAQYVINSTVNCVVEKKILVIGLICIALIVGFNLSQHTPLAVIAYFVLPILVWMVVLNNVKKSDIKNLLFTKNALYCILFYVIVSEVLVYSFFQRKILSIALFIYSVVMTIVAMNRNAQSKIKIIKYFSSSVCLGIFPLLPIVEKDSNTKFPFLLILATIFWIFRSLDYIYLKKRSNAIVVMQSVIMFLGGLFFLYLVVNFSSHIEVTAHQQIISWILYLSPILIFLGSKNMEMRLKMIANGFSLPFILMSLSYEPLFLLAFFINLLNWTEVEMMLASKGRSLKELMFYEPKMDRRRDICFDDLRIGLVFMFYVMIGMFSTGNMASFSSFDPSWVRFLVLTFSPFLMATLIIIKLMIPIIILLCILRALHIVIKIDAPKQFIMILIACDIMCLNFLFLVKNTGSWLEIGTSLSHFIVMECTVFVLTGLYGLAHLLTSFQVLPDFEWSFG